MEKETGIKLRGRHIKNSISFNGVSRDYHTRMSQNMQLRDLSMGKMKLVLKVHKINTDYDFIFGFIVDRPPFEKCV